MNIIGTLYIVDDPHIDVLYRSLATNPPPGQVPLLPNTVLCLDLDESDEILEQYYPNHCQKATVLCPPPAALYKEIDGDQEGFIQLYNQYLDFDSSVQELVATMLYFLHIGGNIILYTPSYIDDLDKDDAIWLNTLMMFFYTRFGITIGTSRENPFYYDTNYDKYNAQFMYLHSTIGVFDFINSYGSYCVNTDVLNKLRYDLAPYCAPGDDPLKFYECMLRNLFEGYPTVTSLFKFKSHS